MHINSMPDLVLRLIFSKLSLHDLVSIGRVCALWKWHQMSIGKQVRSLALLLGSSSAQSLITHSCFTLKYRDLLLNDDGTRMYSSQHLHKWFHLTYDSLSSDCAEELSNIFPHITTLEIAIKINRGQFLLGSIVILLEKWSPMLKSLKMYYYQFNKALFNYQPKNTNEFYNLFEVIKWMPWLEHLTLDTDSQINPSPPTSMDLYFSKILNRPLPNSSNSINLSILGRIREFYLRSSDDVNTIENFLQTYVVPNDNMRQIGLDFPIIEKTYQRFPKLGSKIVYLPLQVSEINSTEVQDTMKSFSSITKLNLINDPTLFGSGRILFKEALNSISSLPQLTHLHVNNYIRFLFPSNQTFSFDSLPQLTSVQVLTIAAKFESISIFESNNWAHLFPNVQVIELVITAVGSDFNSAFLSKQQLQSALVPFVQCPKLHRIFTCEKYMSFCLSGIEHSPPEMFKEWIILRNTQS